MLSNICRSRTLGISGVVGPVVLVGSEFWSPLMDFLGEQLLVSGAIDPLDMGLLQVQDSPAEAVQFIKDVSLGKFGLTFAPRKRRWFLFE
jgi:predicted Rossmann-fold nucleotide-binding protein